MRAFRARAIKSKCPRRVIEMKMSLDILYFKEMATGRQKINCAISLELGTAKVVGPHKKN